MTSNIHILSLLHLISPKIQALISSEVLVSKSKSRPSHKMMKKAEFCE